ncbi:MAG: ABC transporter substrate-binding protein [Candidatus Paceibacterota bacterium]
MNMNQTTKWAIAAVVVIVLLGTAFIFGGRPNPGDITGPIKIGWMGPQTGPSAVLGMDSYVAAQIAVDEINAAGGIDGRLVELYIEDDQYSTEKSVLAYNKLVNVNEVRIIIANTYSSVFALAKRAEADGVLLIDPLDCNNELAEVSENVFCLATDSASVAKVLARAATEGGYSKVGILHFTSDLFMPLVQKVFKESYKGNIVLTEAYPAGTRDFRTPLTKLVSEGADAIVLLGYDETGNAMKQARDLGFKGQFLTTGTVTSPPLQAAAQGAAEGTLLAFWTANTNSSLYETFTKEFQKRQNRPPILDLATYPTYDAVKALARAIDNAGNSSVRDVTREIASITDLEGITGTITFNANGSMLIPESLFKLTGGKVIPQ